MRIRRRKRIKRILEKKTKDNPPIECFRFFKDICREQGVIVTFNYDLVIERILRRMNQGYEYGIEGRKEDGKLILKLHGSVDWARKPISIYWKLIRVLFSLMLLHNPNAGKVFVTEVAFCVYMIARAR